MKILEKWEECNGRTISRVALCYDEIAAFYFTDNTVFIIKAEVHYEDARLRCDSELALYEQKGLGLITEEQYHQCTNDRLAHRLLEQKEQRRKQYEELKREFS